MTLLLHENYFGINHFRYFRSTAMIFNLPAIVFKLEIRLVIRLDSNVSY